MLLLASKRSLWQAPSLRRGGGRTAAAVRAFFMTVVPFWLWATRALEQAGVPNRRSRPAGIALVAGSLAGGHLVAYLVTKNQP